MDPDECLKMCQALARHIIEEADAGLPIADDKAERLAEQFLNLNEWISKGGFLPAAWNVTWNRVEL
jgi:hypothetical protein